MSSNKINQFVELSFNTIKLWSFNLINFWGTLMWKGVGETQKLVIIKVFLGSMLPFLNPIIVFFVLIFFYKDGVHFLSPSFFSFFFF